MQERGITTTAVIIYVIIATIVIATFSVITTDFYETLKKENKQSMYSNKYTEFMSYFAKDVQEKNNAVDTAGVSNSDKGEQIPYITFTNGNTYKFSNENSAIYKNDIKICDNINICVFKKEKADGQGCEEGCLTAAENEACHGLRIIQHRKQCDLCHGR